MMNFQVLEIVGRQLQANIPKLPSDFVTCKSSFQAAKMKSMEVVWLLWQLGMIANLKT